MVYALYCRNLVQLCLRYRCKWIIIHICHLLWYLQGNHQFSANTVGLWASTGSGPLVRVIENQSASTSTNSADFHVGVLRLGDSSTEDWYISGVYIESDSLTTAIGSGGDSNATTSSTTTDIRTTTYPTSTVSRYDPSSTTTPTTSSAPTTSAVPTTSSTPTTTTSLCKFTFNGLLMTSLRRSVL